MDHAVKQFKYETINQCNSSEESIMDSYIGLLRFLYLEDRTDQSTGRVDINGTCSQAMSYHPDDCPQKYPLSIVLAHP